MKRLIIKESQLKIIENHILETIDPEEANNHEKSLLMVINKKRNIGFYGGASEKDINDLKKSGLKYIPINMNNAYVFYNDGYEIEAQELANIARKFSGFLPSTGKTNFNGLFAKPEEVYRIGILLGYDEKSVREFVLEKFKDFKFY